MSNIAIVSVFNNLELVEQMISTAKETCGQYKCQFFAIDNRDNKRFSSAAAAYNSFLDNMPDVDVIIFCHQDILFLKDTIKNIYSLCEAQPNTLFGSAGVLNHRVDKGRIISSMSMIQEGWCYTTLKKGTTQDVFALDECLICGNRELFTNLRFDEDVCDGWHLYAVELSLQCQVKGLKVKVFDADIVHLSGGVQGKDFYSCEKKLARKYRKYYPLINYTCGWTYTDPLRYFVLHTYRKIRYGI